MAGLKRFLIEGFDYEIDELGRLFSINYIPGYGYGYQIMPSKTHKTAKPTYKLTKNGGSITCRVDVLVEQYCTSCERFDSKWFLRTRKAAKEHNEELRNAFLEQKANGFPLSNAPKPKAKKKRTPYVHIPWSNSYELDKSMQIEEEYSAALGIDSCDALICPLR